MTSVILYSRVSTDEQSLGYSLRDQKEKLEKYCSDKGYQCIGYYEDDHSAKTFDRPEFQKLLSFIKKNKGVVSKLVFLRFDRFSRNITDALVMIRELAKLNVSCEAVEQPLDLSVPENKLLLTIYLSAPEIENDRRSLNTIAGTRKAMKEGRWCNHAPFGYKFSRDERNKPILVIVEEKATLVRKAFELYASGIKDKEAIRRMLKPKGMTLHKARFAELFHQPIYAGNIRIKSYGNEPEQIVKGIHPAIVSEEVYNKVQILAEGKRLPRHKSVSLKAMLPLRGFLACPICGSILTGSGSRSYNGNRYFYYHCQSPCKTRFRADEANSVFEAWLERISLKPELTETYLELFEHIAKQDEGDRKLSLKEVEEELTKIKELQLKSDRLYIEEKLDMDAYQRLKEAYRKDAMVLEHKKEELQAVNKNMLKQMEFAFKVMSNLQKLWLELDLEGKQVLLSSIIPGKLIYENQEYRTTENNPLLSELFSIDEACKLKQVSGKGDLSASVAGLRI